MGVDKKVSLGIELGSTRIKAVLIDSSQRTLATGGVNWENTRDIQGYWTYSEKEILEGLQKCYVDLKKDYQQKYNETLTHIDSIGISAMMHGYLAFNKDNELLVPFRTWRNGTTGEAAKKLSEIFDFNIPQRWSIAHLYQAILDKEEHIKEVEFFTTLAGYIHWKLTGKKVLGVGDASGMFPIDTDKKVYNQKMMTQFDALTENSMLGYKLKELLPEILVAGEDAGYLTDEGAALLDIDGDLRGGIPFCPPEGDAGTGMVATNSVSKYTANVSAGTSAFAMVVLDKDLDNVYEEIDLVTTPAGDLVAMVHTNNCTSELNAWVNLFREFSELLNVEIDMDELFSLLLENSENADSDLGSLLTFGYHSGENITRVQEGTPMLIRKPDSKFNLANLMQAHLFSAFTTLKIGVDILTNKENVKITQTVGHGGIFKTPLIAQRALSSAMSSPVLVMDTAGEGGAWGMAILANYAISNYSNEPLEEFLNSHVFSQAEGVLVEASEEEMLEFEEYTKRFEKGLEIQRPAYRFL